jgi:hypothetical protein
MYAPSEPYAVTYGLRDGTWVRHPPILGYPLGYAFQEETRLFGRVPVTTISIYNFATGEMKFSQRRNDNRGSIMRRVQ